VLRGAALLGAAAVVALLTGCGDVVETGPQAEVEGFEEVVVTLPPTTAPDTTDPASTDPGADGSSGSSSPTTPGGTGGAAFEVGDCLTWEQGAPDVTFRVVACSEEHFAEVAGLGDLSTIFDASEEFPEVEVLSAAVAEVCTPIVQEYVGSASTDGVEAGVIPPTEASWAEGDRAAWCTVGLERQNSRRPAYTGRIADGTASSRGPA
jgi:hypothetical protein